MVSELVITWSKLMYLISELSIFNFLLSAVHLHCTNEMIAEDFNDESNSFCGKQCLKVFSACFRNFIISSFDILLIFTI